MAPGQGLHRRRGENAYHERRQSGGGHDAAVFSAAGVPAGMVFVRNRNGSHNPDEAMDVSDFLRACDIFSAYLEEQA